MARKHSNIRLHGHKVYATQDVIRLFDVHPNTVTNWQDTGLRPIEGTRPHLYRGDELMRFHHAPAREKSKRARQTLLPNEFHCLGCRTPTEIDIATISISRNHRGASIAVATCPVCRTSVSKFLGKTARDTLEMSRTHNAERLPAHECNAPRPFDIVISPDPLPVWNAQNEITIYHWQVYAGIYSESTLLAHLGAIRQMEAFLDRKTFTSWTEKDVDLFRNHLKQSYHSPTGQRALAASTLRHTASYLRKFLQWLAQHEPNKGLQGLASYMQLPKAFGASSTPSQPKDFAAIQEAQEILTQLPHETLIEQRDRAIFAKAYLCGFRKEALISLTLSHVDETTRRTKHDGRTMRVKNGKNFTAQWFPNFDVFETVFLEYLAQRRVNGHPQDALFPHHLDLTRPTDNARPRLTPLPVMTSSASVDYVFRVASRILGRNITPHSTRHSLVAHLNELNLTTRARKAWSMNLGHESEITTNLYYGKMGDEERFMLLEPRQAPTATDADPVFLVKFYEHYFTRGTQEFYEAEARINRLRDQIARESIA